MKYLKIMLIPLLLVLVFGYDNNEKINQKVEFTEIGKGSLFGNGNESILRSNLVINNQSDWQNLIDQMNSVNNVSSTFSETSIDFTSFSVIAIFLDIKQNGSEITINTITENETNILVSTQETELDNTVITQPFHIVKIQKTNKEIVFE
tara:strand:+ start:143 stop:589 length:447 start_codon:yes stop_codon:yes gene_type:complete